MSKLDFIADYANRQVKFVPTGGGSYTVSRDRATIDSDGTAVAIDALRFDRSVTP